MMHAFISLVSCILFIVEGYLREECECTGSEECGATCDQDSLPLDYQLSEQALNPVFLCHYMLLLYACRDRVAYVFSLFSLIDIVTVIPVYIELLELFNELYSNGTDEPLLRHATALNVFRAIRAIKVVRILRFANTFTRVFARRSQVTRLPNSTSNQSKEANRQMISLVGTVVLLLVLTTGFVQWLSLEVGWNRPAGRGPGPLQFHEALYYSVVTLSTLGYGDYYPSDTWGRCTMTVFLLFTFFYVPYQTSKFFVLRSLVSAYRGSYNDERRHIVICCDAACASIGNFLEEFFHPDHGVVANLQVRVHAHAQ